MQIPCDRTQAKSPLGKCAVKGVQLIPCPFMVLLVNSSFTVVSSNVDGAANIRWPRMYGVYIDGWMLSFRPMVTICPTVVWSTSYSL